MHYCKHVLVSFKLTKKVCLQIPIHEIMEVPTTGVIDLKKTLFKLLNPGTKMTYGKYA